MLQLYRGDRQNARRQIHRAGRYAAGLVAGAAAAAYGGYKTVRGGAKRFKKNKGYAPGFGPWTKVTRRAKSSYLKPGKNVKSRVKKLERFVENQQSLRICRNHFASVASAAVNSQNIVELQCPNVTTLSGCVDDLRFFNPAAPATLITADLQSATFAQDILMSHFTKVTLKNNYQSNVVLKIYLCKVKADTGISALTSVVNGLADNPSAAVLITDLSVRPRDSEQFRDLYSSKLLKSKVLKPGQSCSASYGSGQFTLDPATLDSHTSAFQRKLKGAAFLFVLEGQMAHNNQTPNDIGSEEVRLDIRREFVIKCWYDAGGVDLRDIQITNAFDTVETTILVASHQPTVDNLSFSTL